MAYENTNKPSAFKEIKSGISLQNPNSNLLDGLGGGSASGMPSFQSFMRTGNIGGNSLLSGGYKLGDLGGINLAGASKGGGIGGFLGKAGGALGKVGGFLGKAAGFLGPVGAIAGAVSGVASLFGGESEAEKERKRVKRNMIK